MLYVANGPLSTASTLLDSPPARRLRGCVREDATATVHTRIAENQLSGCRQGYGIRAEAELDEEDSDPGAGAMTLFVILVYQENIATSSAQRIPESRIVRSTAGD